uniref:RING-type domain-containing protein n=1 Tax=Macrostomum lignano TaxID=282301 RepID=A0A1I8FK35_9PLAT
AAACFDDFLRLVVVATEGRGGCGEVSAATAPQEQRRRRRRQLAGIELIPPSTPAARLAGRGNRGGVSWPRQRLNSPSLRWWHRWGRWRSSGRVLLLLHLQSRWRFPKVRYSSSSSGESLADGRIHFLWDRSGAGGGAFEVGGTVAPGAFEVCGTGCGGAAPLKPVGTGWTVAAPLKSVAQAAEWRCLCSLWDGCGGGGAFEVLRRLAAAETERDLKRLRISDTDGTAGAEAGAGVAFGTLGLFGCCGGCCCCWLRCGSRRSAGRSCCRREARRAAVGIGGRLALVGGVLRAADSGASAELGTAGSVETRVVATGSATNQNLRNPPSARSRRGQSGIGAGPGGAVGSHLPWRCCRGCSTLNRRSNHRLGDRLRNRLLRRIRAELRPTLQGFADLFAPAKWINLWEGGGTGVGQSRKCEIAVQPGGGSHMRIWEDGGSQLEDLEGGGSHLRNLSRRSEIGPQRGAAPNRRRSSPPPPEEVRRLGAYAGALRVPPAAEPLPDPRGEWAANFPNPKAKTSDWFSSIRSVLFGILGPNSDLPN